MNDTADPGMDFLFCKRFYIEVAAERECRYKQLTGNDIIGKSVAQQD